MKQPPTERDLARVQRLLGGSETPAPGGPPSTRSRRRTGRRRRWAGAAVGVVAAAVIVVPPVFLEMSPTSMEGRSAPDPAGGQDTGTTSGGSAANGADPFVSNPCPGRPAPVEAAGRRWPSGEEPVAVRMCPLSLGQQSGAAGWWRPPADALVADLAAFVARVEAAPEADPRRCDAIEPVPDAKALYLEYADGRVAVIGGASSGCLDLDVDGRMVAMTDVLDAFRLSLAAQRAELGPPPEPIPVQVDCTRPVAQTDALLDPATTTVVSMVVCPRLGAGEPYRAGAAGLEVVASAWADAVRADDPAYERTNLCPGVDNDDRIVATTDVGDVWRLEFVGCGDYQVPAGSLGGWHVLFSDAELERLGLPNP